MYRTVSASTRARCTLYLPAGRVLPLTTNSNGTSTTIDDRPWAVTAGLPQNSIAPSKLADATIDLICCNLAMLLLISFSSCECVPIHAHTRPSSYIYAVKTEVVPV